MADCLGVELKPYYVSSAFLAQTGAYDFTRGLLGDKANTVVFDNSKQMSMKVWFLAQKKTGQFLFSARSHF